MIATAAAVILGSLLGWSLGDLYTIKKEVRGLKLRVADIDRDLTALESSLTGDGK